MHRLGGPVACPSGSCIDLTLSCSLGDSESALETTCFSGIRSLNSGRPSFEDASSPSWLPKPTASGPATCNLTAISKGGPTRPARWRRGSRIMESAQGLWRVGAHNAGQESVQWVLATMTDEQSTSARIEPTSIATGRALRSRASSPKSTSIEERP